MTEPLHIRSSEPVTDGGLCTKLNRVEQHDFSGATLGVARMEPCNGHISVFVLGKTDIRICDRCDVPEPARSEVS